MSERLPSALLASALIRRVHDAGGFAAVRAKGDPESGAFLLITLDRVNQTRLFERGLGPTGHPTMIDSTPADTSPDSVESYWRKRRDRDPDLWVIELDIPDGERFAAETIGAR
ncbi:DUF1491 family protein [Sphingomonas lenta]|uniref:DUF1491 domain-containing protein n=1 Tax=Sphingomonas lenta TaxID=1141887 RepID=A0A2A2SE24_9SPHN|nr:DUF1491 family protein [Sphingomonas lenta]PAX07507.1 hypothetical protein CKY28_07530 [Sphingomonas lenta]